MDAVRCRILVHERGESVEVHRRAGLPLPLAGGEQRVTQRQHEPAIRRPRLQYFQLALQLESLLLSCIGRELCRIGIFARLARDQLLLGAFRPRDQRVVLGEIGFAGTRVEQRALFTLLDQLDLRSVSAACVCASARAVSTL